ncbi:superoxide dismutase family protein [Tsuneonella troitsensis]|uniref:superoxide dismutase family protein n=1 Tax=Tsuneonella troitsensis TaxID=292222 RepID=UPI0007090CB9|nr:superoxide dismutase family protein [Tsuneonella troitsensis]
MNALHRLLIVTAALPVGACSTIADLPNERIGGATLSLANGMPAGTVQLVANGSTVSLVAAVTGISPGPHGFHLHAVGSCQAPDFTSAGGHLNPLSREHGTANPDGRHVGDLPNITVQPSGTGSLTAELPGTRAQVEEWVFDTDGTAVVVHANADDYRTDPTGNAGGRIACGIIKRS